MRILSFHIDGFGFFNNVECAGLSPQVNIFFGNNEAGKSTCLDFFRTMLAGYPEKSKKLRSCMPLKGGQPGGSLLLECGKPAQEVRLYRSTPEYGGLRLHEVSGGALHGEFLEKLFSGISARTYRRIFGFGLEELENWDQANDESIRQSLYGATFGPGLNSPAQVGTELEKRMKKIYRSRGNQHPLFTACTELEKLHSDILRMQSENESYNNLRIDQKQAEAQLAALEEDNRQLETEKSALERRLALWHQWEQWQLLTARLASIPDNLESFPEDGASRLARLTANKDSCAQAYAASEEKLRQMKERLDSMQPEIAYLEILGPLRRLAERKSGYRAAIGKVDSLRRACTNAEESLASSLAQLGPDWNCDRIRATDRSLFAREDMEKQASALSEARLAHQAALANLESCNREVERWKTTIVKCEEEVTSFPAMEALLAEEERDALRRNMTRLEECRRLEPGRQRTLESAQTAYSRALEQARIFGTDDHVSGKALIDELLRGQDKAMALAREMQSLLADRDEISRKAGDAEREAERLKKRIEEARNAARANSGSSRAQLEAKSAALRNLRSVASNIKSEEERRDELESRIAQEKIPSRAKNWTFIAFSIVFLICAGAIFCAHWFWGINELRFADDMSMPINLWAAYAALVCGVALFASGFSSHGPEQKRRKAELQRLLGRSEASSMRLADLMTQSQQLCQEAGVDSLDPIDLDASEMLIEREKERMFQEERSREVVEGLQQELGVANTEYSALQKELQAKENEVQQTRRRWHGLMQAFKLENVPSPESAGAMFARVEAAALAQANVESARTELDALWEDLHLLEQSILEMPVIKEILRNADTPPSLEEAVHQVLDNCREADLIREKRIKAEAELQGAREEFERSTVRQLESAENLDHKSHDLAEARAAWAKCLRDLALDEEMDPETVREAYKCMDNSLAAEERLLSCKRELEQAEKEIASFEQPLEKLAQGLSVNEAVEDNLALLDDILAHAEEQARVSDRADALAEDLTRQKEESASRKAALDAAIEAEAALLKQGNADNADAFLRKAALREERRGISTRVEELRLALASAAREVSFEDFVAGFEHADKPRQETRLEGIRRQLEENGRKERDLASRAGALAERSEALAGSGELATLRQKESALRYDIAEMARNWCELAAAKALLKNASDKFEKERQPQLMRDASRIFSNLSGGRWAGISLNLEDSSLRMLTDHGEPVSPINLSRGTREQAYLALRLAFIRQRSESHETLPVLMDEILVNFDPERAKRACQVFADLSRECGQQIIYFTCQPHMLKLLQDQFEESSVYEIRDYQIRAA